MANNYAEMTKEQLLDVIDNLKRRKKYGLVWEEENTKEQYEEAAQNAYPVLKEEAGKAIITDPAKPVNLLIEGDNLHALSVLNYTHYNKVDVIYIDPPYNTGNKDFKYNDAFVDQEDSYRHSKWLSFMRPRLELARNLLKDTGVIFASIDDNEQAQLKLLMDEVFGESNFIGNIIWRCRTGANDSVNNFNTNHEYVAIYSKSRDKVRFKGIDKDLSKYKNPDKDPRGRWVADNLRNPHDDEKQYGTLVDPKTGNTFTGYWRISPRNYRQYIDDGRILFPKSSSGVPKLKRFKNELRSNTSPVSSLWDGYLTSHGTRILIDMFDGKIFGYPKPVKLIKELINQSTEKDAIILDFFAGSGTTGHAVLDLNKEDGGNRQFILATNNENNICTDVTYPRVEKVINGYTNAKGNVVAGLGGNLRYFKTSFVPKSENSDDLKIQITRECVEMLCITEGVFAQIGTGYSWKIFQNSVKTMAVYTGFVNSDNLAALKEDLDKLDGEKVLYCFTMHGNSVVADDFEGWEGIDIKPIPSGIINLYRSIYG
ncbi:site-specific DNA-methyltransferase [Acinetobacter sp.]|uniref:site-specific DNA-methyltransferase n=1 Tax=Acinetobacter sp. TaxID=472 RepID=UPI003CFC052D